MNVKILVCYHKEYEILPEYKNTDVYIPIFGGKQKYTGNNIFLKNMLGDNTGDNVSHLNEYINEMTVIYWAWKNYDKIGNPDLIGLHHYRRTFPENSYLDNNNKPYDIVLWENVLRTHCPFYTISHLHRYYLGQNIYNPLFTYLKTENTEKANYILEHYNNTEFFTKNMFIMKKQIFFDYCNWIFPVVFKIFSLYHLCNVKRAPSFLSEQLTSIYLSKLLNTKEYNVNILKIPHHYV